MEERQHHLNESSSARLRRSQKFCRAQIVRVWAPIFWAHTSFVRREDFNGRLVTIVYYDANILDVAHIFYICADILDRARIF